MPDYDSLAVDRLSDLLRTELALVWPEVEAKLAEPRFGKGIDPHHLQNARRALRNQHLATETADYTTGGHLVGVLTPTDRRGRSTAIDRAAASKRKLQARYLAWAGQSPSGQSLSGSNFIGRGGEAVLRASLEAAATAGSGLRIESGGDKGVSSLFHGKAAVPIGPLDGAAYITAFGEDTGLPVAVTALYLQYVRSRPAPLSAFHTGVAW